MNVQILHVVTMQTVQTLQVHTFVNVEKVMKEMEKIALVRQEL